MTEASEFFREVRKHPERFYIIHYSSEGLYDDAIAAQGLSPRITSIAVMHLLTRQTVTFATHAIAEELKIPKQQIEAQFDLVERTILERFYKYVQERRTSNWVHWNMRNIVFGFEHVEHRYRTLTGGDPVSIPVEVRVNLNDVLKDRYGHDYAPDPKLHSLMRLNGTPDPKVLTGAEEAAAFKTKDYIRMHSSTIGKVEFFRYVIQLANDGRLKTVGKGMLVQLDKLMESRLARVVTFVTTVLTFLGLLVAAAGWLIHGVAGPS